MRVRDIEIAGGDGATVLRLAEAGDGGRPLVLVHGFTGAKEDFTAWLDRLAELGWHAIAPDQRGHGESPKPADEAAYSVEAFAKDLMGLVDAMGWSTTAALGHSMGGMVVQTAALRSPHRFDALILMDTSHKALRADPDVIDLAIELVRTEGMAALLAAQEALGGDGPLASDIDRRLKAERPGYKEFGDRKLLASAPAMYAAMIRSITDPAMEDRLELLGALTMPSLVVVGEHDRPFLRPSERMAEVLPNGELVRVAGAAHSPQFESPDAWWTAIAGFLSRLP